jgi:ribosomal protein S18 acetylase RimI-like enzyme
MAGVAGPSIEVVAPSEADLPQLFGLAKSTFAHYPGWSDERVLEALATDTVFVALERGRPAGYVAMRPEPREAMLVEQILVAPGHELRGVGRMLLAYAEAYAIAERAGTLRIVVEEDNRRARSFYRRSGFVPVAAELFELVLPRSG